MLGTYAYNEIFRKTIVALGTLFNNIEIRRSDEVMKVPLAYGPKQKFLARLDQNPDPTNKRVQITLPRLSFEINSIGYDPARKVSPTQKIQSKQKNNRNETEIQFEDRGEIILELIKRILCRKKRIESTSTETTLD